MLFKISAGVFKHYRTLSVLRKFATSVIPKTMKIDSPNFRAMFTPEVKSLAEIFQKHGYELRIAGGAIRDLLMNIQPEDIDFASTATPDQMKQMFQSEEIRMINAGGEGHGTITARINDKQNFEITTLRIDTVTDGRRAKVEFTRDWYLDANRRDLTINSMFLGLDGTIYDYFHGAEDLEKRRVAFVGDPVKRIQEDYLRILRYFRFYGRIAVEPDKHEADVLTALRENMEGLQNISGERLWLELKKILQGKFSKEIVLRLLDLGMGPYIGLTENANIEEYKLAADRSLPLKPQPVTLLSGLFRNEEDVLRFRARTKFSNYERDLALFIVVHKTEERQLMPFQSLVFSTKGKQSDIQEWVCETLKYLGEAKLLDEFRGWQIPKFPVTGNLLIDQGHKAGPKIAFLITQLRVLWFNSNFTMTADELLEKLPEVINSSKK